METFILDNFPNTCVTWPPAMVLARRFAPEMWVGELMCLPVVGFWLAGAGVVRVVVSPISQQWDMGNPRFFQQDTEMLFGDSYLGVPAWNFFLHFLSLSLLEVGAVHLPAAYARLYRHMSRYRFLGSGVMAAVFLALGWPVGGVAQKPLVVGYLPQWGMYATPPWTAKALVTNGTARLLDQIDYSQAAIVNGRCALADPKADVQQVYTAANSVDGTADAAVGTTSGGGAAPLRGELHQLEELHRKYPRIRMLISIEGKPALFADAAQPSKRAAFVASCIDMFVRGNLQPELGAAGVHAPGLFTGIDVDWEYPNGPAAADGSTQGANYSALLTEFRRQMDAYATEDDTYTALAGGRAKRASERLASFGKAQPQLPLLLTVAAAPGMRRYPGVDWPLVSRTVDQVGLMTYDYNGPWQKTTGMVAPLYAVAGQQGESGNVDATVQAYEAAGVPAAKLVLGVPLYGYHWTGVKQAGAQHGLGMQGKPDEEDAHDADIAQMAAARPESGKLFRIEPGETPWIYDGENFWTFDDAVSAKAKAVYARQQGLGGVMLWHLGGDTRDGGIVKAVAGVER